MFKTIPESVETTKYPWRNDSDIGYELKLPGYVPVLLPGERQEPEPLNQTIDLAINRSLSVSETIDAVSFIFEFRGIAESEI